MLTNNDTNLTVAKVYYLSEILLKYTDPCEAIAREIHGQLLLVWQQEERSPKWVENTLGDTAYHDRGSVKDRTQLHKNREGQQPS